MHARTRPTHPDVKIGEMVLWCECEDASVDMPRTAYVLGGKDVTGLSWLCPGLEFTKSGGGSPWRGGTPWEPEPRGRSDG